MKLLGKFLEKLKSNQPPFTSIFIRLLPIFLNKIELFYNAIKNAIWSCMKHLLQAQQIWASCFLNVKYSCFLSCFLIRDQSDQYIDLLVNYNLHLHTTWRHINTSCTALLHLFICMSFQIVDVAEEVPSGHAMLSRSVQETRITKIRKEFDKNKDLYSKLSFYVIFLLGFKGSCCHRRNTSSIQVFWFMIINLICRLEYQCMEKMNRTNFVEFKCG